MLTSDARTKPIFRMLLLGATLAVVIPLVQAMATGTLPAGTGAHAAAALAAARRLAWPSGPRAKSLARRAAVRRATEYVNFFDDLSLLRPRAQAARAMLAGEPANDVERRSVVAVSQCLAEMARPWRKAARRHGARCWRTRSWARGCARWR